MFLSYVFFRRMNDTSWSLSLCYSEGDCKVGTIIKFPISTIVYFAMTLASVPSMYTSGQYCSILLGAELQVTWNQHVTRVSCTQDVTYGYWWLVFTLVKRFVQYTRYDHTYIPRTVVANGKGWGGRSKLCVYDTVSVTEWNYPIHQMMLWIFMSKWCWFH